VRSSHRLPGERSCTFAVRIMLRALPLSCSFTPVCSRDHLSQPSQSLRRYLNRAREQFHGRLVGARASSRLCPAGGPAYSFHGYDSIVCVPRRAGTKQSDGVAASHWAVSRARRHASFIPPLDTPGLDHRVGSLVSMRPRNQRLDTAKVAHQPPPVPPSLGGGVGGRGWAACAPTQGRGQPPPSSGPAVCTFLHALGVLVPPRWAFICGMQDRRAAAVSLDQPRWS
jgi:hypothetical protein